MSKPHCHLQCDIALFPTIRRGIGPLRAPNSRTFLLKAEGLTPSRADLAASQHLDSKASRSPSILNLFNIASRQTQTSVLYCLYHPFPFRDLCFHAQRTHVEEQTPCSHPRPASATLLPDAFTHPSAPWSSRRARRRCSCATARPTTRCPRARIACAVCSSPVRSYISSRRGSSF